MERTELKKWSKVILGVIFIAAVWTVIAEAGSPDYISRFFVNPYITYPGAVLVSLTAAALILRVFAEKKAALTTAAAVLGIITFIYLRFFGTVIVSSEKESAPKYEKLEAAFSAEELILPKTSLWEAEDDFFRPSSLSFLDTAMYESDYHRFSGENGKMSNISLCYFESLPKISKKKLIENIEYLFFEEDYVCKHSPEDVIRGSKDGCEYIYFTKSYGYPARFATYFAAFVQYEDKISVIEVTAADTQREFPLSSEKMLNYIIDNVKRV